MTDASVTFYPVGNGDTTLIRLTDGWAIMIDCNIRACDDDEKCYPVHEKLLDDIDRDAHTRPYINAFILTHPDQDHCRGFQSVFYTGPPSEYPEEDKKNELILINELWFPPRVFADHEDELCDDAKAFLTEAERRMELYRNGDDGRNDLGNRLRIIGLTDSEDIEGLDGIVSNPGDVVDEIDGKRKDDFSFFVHAPFKADTDSEDGERNNASVVLQARFDVDDEVSVCLAIFGGDADYRVWSHILNKSDDDSLSWDLLQAPHHCSWTFFNDHGESEPHPDSMSYLNTAAMAPVLSLHANRSKMMTTTRRAIKPNKSTLMLSVKSNSSSHQRRRVRMTLSPSY
ncbi:MAG: hypothetical protein OXG68_14765 [Chloroflexi bacterium]|nr:hypothetical protein [Chloroflexota bacterium]